MKYEDIEKQLKDELGEISEKEKYHFQLLVDAWAMYLTLQRYEVLDLGLRRDRLAARVRPW
jgi:hypothetical protein